MTEPDKSQTMATIRRTVPIWLLLLAGLTLTAIVGDRSRRAIEQHADHEIAASADQLTLLIRERLHAYALILRGGAGLLSQPDEVNRQDWHDYVATLRAGDGVPGVQGIGFARLIPAGQLQDHVLNVRAEGFPQYTVWPEGERDAYSAIVFLEPFSDRNMRAFGYDMFSESVRREAMERARDSGAATLSGMVELVQETGVADQPGTLMYVPVYRRGLSIDSVEARRAALVGWAYSPYRMTDLMTGIIGRWRDGERDPFEFDIYDGGEAVSDQLLFSSDGRAGAGADAIRSLQFNGRDWLVTLRRAQPSSAIGHLPVWFVLIAGSAISLLVFLLLLSLSSRQERARRLALRLTVDIRQREEALREHESRWRAALEGSGLGVWDWRIPDNRVIFSKVWKEMLGYADHEIGNDLSEWEKRIHPDDKSHTEAAVQDYLDGKTPYYVSEHRVRCKDGTYKWILDRGMIFERDDDGKPLRIVGTHSDITESRDLRDSLRQTSRELLEAQRIAKVGSWRADLATNRIAWTEETFRIFRMEPAARAPDCLEQEKFFAPEAWRDIRAAADKTIADGEPFKIESQFSGADGSRGWIVTYGEAERDEHGKVVALRGAVADITGRKQAELRSQKIGRLYAALSMSNAAILHGGTAEEVFDNICRVIVEYGGMKLAWIGETDRAAGKISPISSYGDGREYLDGIEISLSADDPRGRGATGTAGRENRAVWIDDFAHDPRTVPWRERAASHGWRSSAALPLTRAGAPCAVLTFYAGEPDMFDDETCALFDEMAAQISFALDKIDGETERGRMSKVLAEQEARFRAMAEQSTVGIYTVDQRKFAYINPHGASIFGYSVNELIGQPPELVVSEDSRALAMENIRRREAGEIKHLRYSLMGRRKDGSTVPLSIDSTTVVLDGRNVIMGVLQDISEQVEADRQIRDYVARIETMIDGTVRAISTMVELRDPYTSGHEQRVGELAAAIAAEIGLSSHIQHGLRLAGAVHDVGKLAVPAEILSKPGKLTRPEFELVKAHAAQGYEMLKGIDSPWPLADVAHQHHERIDGSGYPRGLKGDAICLEARILAVADVVESMSSHRPYRPQLGIERALEEIQQGRGTAYDAAATDACLRLFRDKGYELA